MWYGSVERDAFTYIGVDAFREVYHATVGLSCWNLNLVNAVAEWVAGASPFNIQVLFFTLGDLDSWSV